VGENKYNQFQWSLTVGEVDPASGSTIGICRESGDSQEDTLREWSTDQVATHVTELTSLFGAKAREHADVFKREEIDGQALMELEDGDLQELGLPVGHRKKFIAYIKALRTSKAPLSATPQPAAVAYNQDDCYVEEC
jgi:hypothetical protein